MKRFLITSILATIVAAGTALMAQDYPDEYLGLPGDNLNLYAVMKQFQESETLEGFERTLNDENSRINNLDLNGDNYIDYIKVIDYVDGDVHTIVLQAQLGRNETQDVAVFTVQRFRDGSVQIQLTGDEDLYGRNYIIEPIFDETPNPGYLGRSGGNNVAVVRTTTVQIAAWPLVRFIYMPSYVVWRSSWYWGYYPSYWHPWQPFYWHYYYGYHYHWYPEYYSHYRHWNNHRYTRWNDFYYNGKRSYSRNVVTRVKSGNYRTTYSHPESRRDGEALFAKSHPDRPTRSSVVSTGGNSNRRSVSRSTETTRSSGQSSGNSRRSSTTVNENRSVNTSTRQNNAAIPRSTTTTNNRANTNSTAGQSRVSNRRSSGTVNSNSNTGTSSGQSATRQAKTNSAAGQSAGSSRRSSSGNSGQAVSKPSSGQRSQSAASSSGSKSSGSTSARKSSGSSGSSKATKSSSSKKTSKSTKSENKTSRRK